MVSVGFLFFIANGVLWLAVISVQALESTLRLIPRRSPSFRYFQDWQMALWGDLVGLSLIDWVAGYYVFSVSFEVAALAVSMGLAGTAAFHYVCMSGRHRPDSGYPARGRTSVHGYAHLFYLFIQSILCGAVFLLAVQGIVQSWPLVLALCGTIIYFLSYLEDWRSGALDS